MVRETVPVEASPSHERPAPRRAQWRSDAAAALAFLLALSVWQLAARPASGQAPPAQPSIPGLIVTMPPQQQPAAPGGGQQQPVPSLPGLVISNQPPPAAAAPPPPAAAPPKRKAAVPKAKSPAKAADAEHATAVPKIAGQGIVALVNDEPITAYEVERRARFMSLSADIKERATEGFKRMVQQEGVSQKLKAILEDVLKTNPGKSREQLIAIFEERKKQFAIGLQKQAIESARASFIPQFRKQGLEELIEERLKLQEAKRMNIAVGEEDVTRALKTIADKNKMTIPQFGEYIKKMGGDIDIMRLRFKAQLAWREVIRRKFGHQISISGKDVDQLVATAKAGSGAENVELKLQRIVIPMAGKLDQALLARQQAEAERLQREFKGCASSPALAKSVAGARFEEMGFKQAASIAEPTRTFLLSAKEGEMAPPSLTGAGIELFAVCARRVQAVTEAKREEAHNELAMREFEVLARRHLRDLRQEAHIDIR